MVVIHLTYATKNCPGKLQCFFHLDLSEIIFAAWKGQKWSIPIRCVYVRDTRRTIGNTIVFTIPFTKFSYIFSLSPSFTLWLMLKLWHFPLFPHIIRTAKIGVDKKYSLPLCPFVDRVVLLFEKRIVFCGRVYNWSHIHHARSHKHATCIGWKEKYKWKEREELRWKPQKEALITE